MEYKVTNAIKSREFEGKFGKAFEYTIELEGQGQPVKLSQKPETPAPKAGDTLQGTIETTPYGLRFVKERKGSGGFGGYRPINPEERASIERQVCLKSAVEFACAKVSQGEKIDGAQVLKMADTFVGWLSEHKAVPTLKNEPAVPTIEDINLNDLQLGEDE